MSALRDIPDNVPCKKTADRMFPDPRNTAQVEAARYVCESGNAGRRCPFYEHCLAYAIKHEVEGVWAGTTEGERKDRRRRHGIRPEKVSFGSGARGWGLEPCGTPAAYRRHFRNGEKPCAVCVDGYQRHQSPENNSQWSGRAS